MNIDERNLDSEEIEYQRRRAERMRKRREALRRQLFIRKCIRLGVIAFLLVLIAGVGGYKLVSFIGGKTQSGNAGVVDVQAKTPDDPSEAARQPIRDADNMEKLASASTGWQTDDKGTWYQNADGSFYVSGWKEIDGNQYYFDDSGYIIKDDWLEKDGEDFYFNADGQYDATVKKPMVALTFDDGPGKYTDRLLDVLEANNAKATFFLLGQNAEKFPEQVKREKDLGMEIGNHTYDHQILTKIDIGNVSTEVSQTNEAIKNIIGEPATVMRTPGGAQNADVLAQIGMPVVLWSIDTTDWKTKDVQNTIDVTLNNVQDGSVVLMHDIHEFTVEAAEQIIPALVEKGYKLVTVSELAKAKGITLENGKSYSYFGEGEQTVE